MILYWTSIRALDGPCRAALRRLAAAMGSPARQYRLPDDEARHLAGLALAVYAFTRQAGSSGPVGLPELLRDPDGKPFFLTSGEDGEARFECNVSHSGDYAVCLAGAGPVGVDIERIARAPLEIAENHFTAAERLYLSRFSGAEADRAFFIIWSMKESYLKALGRGLLDELSGIEMVGPDGLPCREFAGWRIETSDVFPGYSLAWCCRRGEGECEFVAVPPRRLEFPPSLF